MPTNFAVRHNRKNFKHFHLIENLDGHFLTLQQHLYKFYDYFLKQRLHRIQTNCQFYINFCFQLLYRSCSLWMFSPIELSKHPRISFLMMTELRKRYRESGCSTSNFHDHETLEALLSEFIAVQYFSILKANTCYTYFKK